MWQEQNSFIPNVSESINPRTALWTINTHHDISEVIDQLSSDLNKVSIVGFDLDGTVLGNGIIFPGSGMASLNEKGKKVTIVSGAGPVSIRKKIVGAGQILRGDKRLVEIPFAANEGSQIFHAGALDGDLSPNHLLYEQEISSHGTRELSSFAHEYQDFVDFYGFYPSGRTSDPFNYVLYTRRDLMREKLIEKYPKSVITEDLLYFLTLLEEQGASKFIAKSQNEDTFRKVDAFHHLRGVNNEGFYNIVDRDVNKLTGLIKLAGLHHMRTVASEELAYFGNDWNDREALVGAKVGFIVDSKSTIRDRMVPDLLASKKGGHLVVLNPSLVNDCLTGIAKI